jgi:ribose 5-phosphate isomerase A
MPGGEAYVTDGGNVILDCKFGPVTDPAALERDIAMIPGALESGLFVGRASAVVSASEEGVQVLTRGAREPA